MGDTMDLMDMLEHKDYRVRELVASHGMAKHLNILIHDSNPIVRGEVAANRRKKDLEILKSDENEPLREYVWQLIDEMKS